MFRWNFKQVLMELDGTTTSHNQHADTDVKIVLFAMAIPTARLNDYCKCNVAWRLRGRVSSPASKRWMRQRGPPTNAAAPGGVNPYQLIVAKVQGARGVF